MFTTTARPYIRYDDTIDLQDVEVGHGSGVGRRVDVPGVGDVAAERRDGALEVVRLRLTDDAGESHHGDAAVGDLLPLELLEVGTLGESRGVEHAAGVQALHGVGLRAALGLNVRRRARSRLVHSNVFFSRSKLKW